MRKLKLGLIIIISAISNRPSIAQELTLHLRHMAGINAIELTGGTTLFGKEMALNAYGYKNEAFMTTLGLRVEDGLIVKTKFQSSLVYAGLNYTLFHFRDKCFLNAGGGVILGDEKYNNEVFKAITSTIDYGFLAEINAEFYLTNRCAFVFAMDEIFDYGSLLGQFHYTINAGLRIYMNTK